MLVVALTCHTAPCRASGSLPAMDSNDICQKSRRTAGNQAALCQSQPEVLYAVARGTSLGVRECQHQFRNHQWNCTQQGKSFRRILQQGERIFQHPLLCIFVNQIHNWQFPKKKKKPVLSPTSVRLVSGMAATGYILGRII